MLNILRKSDYSIAHLHWMNILLDARMECWLCGLKFCDVTLVFFFLNFPLWSFIASHK